MKKYILLALATLCMLTTACLKDEVLYDYSSIQPLVIIPNANWPSPGQPPGDSVFSASAPTAEIKLYARISYEKPLAEPLRVTFQKDTSLVTQFNNQWQTSYSFLPDSCYQTDGLVLTIPAGVRQTYLPLTLFPHKINPAATYLLAFTLMEAGGLTIASNLKSVVISIRVE